MLVKTVLAYYSQEEVNDVKWCGAHDVCC